MKQIKQAVILAGGLGTRLYPLTLEIPKPLLPVRGIPILSYLVSFLQAHRISEIFILISHAHRQKFFKWRQDLPPPLASRIIFIEEKSDWGRSAALNWLCIKSADRFF